jgi:D-alanyl-D-alanine carboxypeptidase
MIGVLRQAGWTAQLRRAAGFLAIWIAILATLAPAANANERYAAFVIDALNGKVLFARNADAARYPASLTKVMTLYILFEELQAGRLRPDSRLTASQNAANQAPSKIGIKAGETITVDQAIRFLVTKSANDVAVVVAENVSGSVPAFAARMTRTARAIGMNSTTFANPHGLPNDAQRTTARDMATLAIQIMRRFPQYYGYFQTRSATWKGTTFGNHNKLLGTVAGVDGLKTGYIRASGFNLVSSMRRDGRHIVAVVMGGRTGASRDAHMRELLETYIKSASRGGALIASVPPPPVATASAPAALAAAPLPTPRPELASLPVGTASLPVPRMLVPSTTVPGTLVTAGATASLKSLDTLAASATATPPPPYETGSTDSDPPVVRPGDWVIQVGAFNSEALAREALQRAQAALPDRLGAATAFTETTEKNGTTLWRARFAGFDKPEAEGACAELKRNSFGCFPAQN